MLRTLSSRETPGLQGETQSESDTETESKSEPVSEYTRQTKQNTCRPPVSGHVCAWTGACTKKKVYMQPATTTNGRQFGRAVRRLRHTLSYTK